MEYKLLQKVIIFLLWLNGMEENSKKRFISLRSWTELMKYSRSGHFETIKTFQLKTINPVRLHIHSLYSLLGNSNSIAQWMTSNHNHTFYYLNFVSATISLGVKSIRSWYTNKNSLGMHNCISMGHDCLLKSPKETQLCVSTLLNKWNGANSPESDRLNERYS